MKPSCHVVNNIVFFVAVGTNISIRVIDGTTPSSGILQVYDGISEWGDVCAITNSHRRLENFQTADAACRSLGYLMALSFFRTDPRDEVDIFIKQANCGPNDYLDQCLLRGWKTEATSCVYIIGIVCLEG